jgi:hypothetical protein
MVAARQHDSVGPALTDASNGRRVVAILEAAQRSLENHGRSEPVAARQASEAAR